MNIGDYLLIAGFAAGFIELFVLVWFSTQEKERWQRYSEIFAGLSTLFLAVALVQLAIYFLTDDFSIAYVVEHSQVDSPTLIKLSGIWSGQSGSLLLWAALVGVFAFIYKASQKQIDQPGEVQRTYAILAVINLAFILLVLLDNPFQTRRAVLDGFGLNPLLRTNWNVIHPVVVFFGYAATTVPFAIALSRLFSRDTINKHQKAHLDLHMALAWLFLSLGIILGGYWAYITLGWGGYWAWDPVETGSLIPWILCTAYFHPRPLFKADSRIPSVVAAFSFIMVLYATFVTRGGVLQSVHAFSESPVTWGLVMLIVGALIAVVGSFIVTRPSFSFGLERFRQMSLYNQSMSIAFLCLIVLAFVCTMGVFLPLILLLATGAQYAVEPAFYTYGCAPFAIIMIFALITCHLTRYSKDYDLKRLSRRFFAAPLVLGVLLAVFKWPTSNFVANFGLPILALASGVTLYRLLHSSFTIESFSHALRESSRAAIHAGLVIILFGAFASSTMTIQENDGQSFEVPIGVTRFLEDTGISVHVYGTSFTQFNSEIDFVMLVQIGVIDGNDVYLQTARLVTDQNYLMANGDPHLYSHPAIFHSIGRDIYVSVAGIAETSVLLRVSILRLVSFVWIGSILLCIGIVPLLAYRGIAIMTETKPTAPSKAENGNTS